MSLPHFFAAAFAIFAIAALVATLQYTHGRAASNMYASTILSHSDGTQDGGFFGEDLSADPGKANSAILMSLGREGATWARNSHYETTVWACVLLFLLAVVLGYHFWQSSLGLGDRPLLGSGPRSRR